MAKSKTKTVEKKERKTKLEDAASDAVPLKKKKLTPEVPTIPEAAASQVGAADNVDIKDLSPEERRKFERKLKKERKKEEKRLKRETLSEEEKEEEPEKPSGCELALQYLKTWSENRKEWKFHKARQTWLLLHMYDTDKVPDEYFRILLDYMVGLKGHARDLTVQKAEASMKEHDGQDSEQESELQKVSRIREVLQLLS